jgi:hypothetical protein
VSLLVNLVPEKYHASRFVEIMRKLEQLVRSLASGSPVIGGSANSVIYVNSAGNVEAADADIQFNGTQLQLPVQGNTGGVRIGTDVDLYRSAANTLTIPDSVTITGTATLGSTAYLGTFVSGDIIYASASNTLSALAKGTDAEVLTLVAGLPSWEAIPPLAIGNAVSGGGANRLLYEDASQNLAASANLTFDGTTLTNLGSTAFGDATTDTHHFRGNFFLHGNAANVSCFFEGDSIIAWQTGTSQLGRFHYANPTGSFRWTNDSLTQANLTADGQLQLPQIGSSAGVRLGGDVDLYRSAADTLTIPDAVTITGVTTLTTMELGHASDTTISRVSAGVIAVEGNTLAFASSVTDHINDATDAHDASAISFVAAGGLSGANVQAVLEELDTEKQPLDGGLTDIAGLAVTDGNIIVGDGANWVAESGATARASLGLTIGTHVQAWSSNLDEYSAVNPTAYGLTLVALADETALEATLDTLPNLTSVQGLTVTLADAGADAVLGWDDSAGAYENLTATEVLDIIKTVDGSGSGLDADLLDGNSSAFFATATGLSDHLSDTSGAHAASAISFTPAGTIAATDVQAAIEELDATLGTATLITVADTTDATCFPALFESATGDLAPKTDGGLTYNASNGTLAATAFSGPLTGNVTGNVTGDVTGNVSGNAGTVTVADAGGDTTTFPLLATDATGSLSPRTDAGLSYNANTNALTTTTVIAALTGNASTATALQTPRTIGGTSFDGTANIVPATITVADTTDSTCFPALFESATGDLAPKTDGGLTYNASNGTLAATAFSGPLTGNVTGDVTGNAGTVTWADEATDTTCFIGFATAASGSLAPKTNANMTFNSNTGVVTLASAVLTTADINGGTVDGAVIGGASAAAVTGTTITANTGFMPDANDGAYLGQSGTAFSDLFLASGAVIDFAAGDVTVTHSSETLTVAGGTLVADDALIVSTGTSVTYNGSVIPAFQVNGDSANSSSLGFSRWAVGAGAPFFIGAKSRGGGTVGVHGAVIDGEDLFFIIAEGSDGSAFFRAARIHFEAEGTISAGVVPGRVTFDTANSAGTATPAFRIDSAQHLFHYANFVSETAYSRLAFKHVSTTLASVSGATVTATNIIPARANLIGVNTKVTVALGTGGGTTGYQVGDGADADRWGNITGTSTNTDTDGNNATADPSGGWSTAARNVVLTANGGNFNGTGSIRVDVFYTITEAD